MAQVFGTIEQTFTENDKQFTVFRIPAFSSRLARQRARGNARVKGLSDFEVGEAENVGSADVPGQKLFDVTVESER